MFKPPTIEEVEAYGKLRNLTVNPQKFLMHYEDSDPPWTNTNGKPVKNWKLTAQSWHFNNMARADTHRCSRCKNYGVYVYKDSTGQPYWRCIDHKLKPQLKALPAEIMPKLKVVESHIVNVNNERNKAIEKLAVQVHKDKYE